MLHNSQLRFERITEIIAQDWFKKVAEMINQVFKDPKIKGVIAGGPGPTKYSFMNEDYILPDVKKKIKGSIDTSYTDEFGIKEVADRSGEVIKELEIQYEKDLVNKFLKAAVTGGLATYGINEIKEALAIGKVETLLLSEGLDDKLVEELTDIAEKTDAKIEMVSTETPEGEQFRIGFKGIGAFLRYK
jgi:peptide chain release factor subunit 1